MALEPRTKAAKVRKYMPEIEQKLAEGASVRDVLTVLNAHGLELTEGTFRHYLHQYRKKQRGNMGEHPKPAIADNTASIEPDIPMQDDNTTPSEPISAEELNRVMYPENPQLQAAKYAAHFKANRSKKT